jgi:ketosteroid isomerase-like protein
MRKLLIILTATFISFSVLADHHNSSAATEVKNASEAFNQAYETNDVEGYFNHYTDDAMLYFYGDRWEVAAYYEYWKNSMVGAGGGVEKNSVSDMQVKVMPGGDTAIVAVFVDNRSRSPKGEINEEKGYETEIWQKIDGTWKIVSLHYSVILPE